ncbi:MAG: hypothetical protein AAFV88_08890 [Planctomycetota bacterium]
MYWQSLPFGNPQLELIRIDPSWITLARRDLRALIKQPVAQPGSSSTEQSHWFERLYQVIESLSAVLSGADPEQLWQFAKHPRAESLLTLRPELSSLLNVFGFLHFTQPPKQCPDRTDSVDDALTWIHLHRDSLAETVTNFDETDPECVGLRDSVSVAVLLCCFRDAIRPQDLDGLFRLLKSPGVIHLCWEAPDEFRSELRRRLFLAFNHQTCSPVANPIETNKTGCTHIRVLLERLRFQALASRSGVLRLLAVLGSRLDLHAFDQIEHQLSNDVRRMLRVRADLLSRQPSIRWDTPEIESLRKTVAMIPRQMAESSRPPFQSLCLLLTSHRFTDHGVASTLCHWMQLPNLPFTSALDIASRWIKQLPVATKHNACKRLASLTRLVFSEFIRAIRTTRKPRKLRSTITQSVQGHASKRCLLLRGILDAIYHGISGSLSRQQQRSVRRLVRFVQDTSEPSLGLEFSKMTDAVTASLSIIFRHYKTHDAAKFVKALQHINPACAINEDQLRLAKSLESKVEKQARCAAFLIHATGPRWQSLNWLIESQPGKHFLRQLIGSRQPDRVLRLLDSISRLQNICDPLPTWTSRPSSNTWIANYPRKLHQPLSQLCEAVSFQFDREHSESKEEDVSAQTIAERVLASDLPPLEKTVRERRYLQSLLDQESNSDLAMSTRKRRGIAHRVSVLTSWLESPPPISEQRLSRLAEKLEMRASFEFEKRCVAGYRAMIREVLEKHGIDNFKRLEPALLERLVGGVVELNASFQALGWKVLGDAARFDGTDSKWQDPWLAQPANQSFLQKMKSLGIEISPWLDAHRGHVLETDSGTGIRVAFARDPLNALLMGHHFATCLSPGDINFFSTIATAVDANKQVLYAHTTEGTFVGRCLMAIDTKGQLLVYSAYSRCLHQELCAAIRQFAFRLATDMKTSVANEGEVETLVADDWYDDGPVYFGKTERSPPAPTADESVPTRRLAIKAYAMPAQINQIDLSAATSEFLTGLFTDFHDGPPA